MQLDCEICNILHRLDEGEKVKEMWLLEESGIERKGKTIQPLGSALLSATAFKATLRMGLRDEKAM